jgi:hypothetical protein
MVSPCVTTYAPNGFINVDSALKETVTVTGIDSEFDVSLNETDAIKLLNGFTVSGFYVDSRLGKRDPELAALAVDLSGAEFQSVIASAIGEATNSSGKTIDRFLADELRAAFIAAFSNYLPTTAAAIAGDGVANALVNGGDAAQTAQSTEPGQDARAGTGAVAVTVETTIAGFKVDVLTNGATAANNLVTQHTQSNSASPANIFRQIPKASWVQYLSDASGWAQTYLNTNALPMLKSDFLTFVFDMDVSTAGSNAGINTAEDVPVVGTQSTSYGEQKFSLNLANRRVALNIKLTNGSGAFTVGGAGLRAQTAVSVEGANPGAGTNPA